MTNVTALKLAESKIQQRLLMHHDHRINADGSTDARKAIAPVTRERVTKLKTSTSTTGGQYRQESSGFSKYKVLVYPYIPNQVFRRSLIDGREIPILEKIGGEWFPCEGVILSQNEINQMKSFEGSIGLDVDAAIARKRPEKSKVKGTYSVGGKYVYRCGANGSPNPDKHKQRRSKNIQAANKVRSLIAAVEICSGKRK